MVGEERMFRVFFPPEFHGGSLRLESACRLGFSCSIGSFPAKFGLGI